MNDSTIRERLGLSPEDRLVEIHRTDFLPKGNGGLCGRLDRLTNEDWEEIPKEATHVVEFPTLNGWETAAYDSLFAAEIAADEFREHASQEFLDHFGGAVVKEVVR